MDSRYERASVVEFLKILLRDPMAPLEERMSWQRWIPAALP